ncbi:MAG TPA: DUF4864 domain-containing protein [Thermohalobaculum sp.]|nr:DUF4864 domain-containing protein [Thermohalobaculum sp.]
MRQFLSILLILLAAGLPVRADEPADTIQSVISAQVEALRANDLTAAFAYASPFIQSKFGTPENFGRIVATGYPVILRPAGYDMLGLVDTSGGPVQNVMFQDRGGRLFEAAYQMQMVDGVWRINGVVLRAYPGVGS